ncbi:unnamed protein product [Ambrosiozyma monospora]|uniref:Unnamed protein product n=1 Tax=Ambrosiozyma monospora TaxID=43982 RepID=A0ACB5U6W1_AMBMO|nr:unnamed protein product [Ambrosiozyma monospora]
MGRLVCLSLRSRGVLEKLEISKRPFYGTTTFDTELSLVTCNLGLVDDKKFVWDPFVGTGSFLLAASEFGAIGFGNDIDFLTLKGKKGKRIRHNFAKVDRKQQYGDAMCMDFNNCALRNDFQIDCILCDPPYGIREGLKVCGVSDPEKMKGKETLMIDGELAFLRRDYIQPKRTFSLDLLLDELLQFAVDRLPIGGRLCFWMPVANDEDIPTMVPQNKRLELIYNLQQDFNRWSRRCLVYVKRDEDFDGVSATKEDRGKNNFRDRYFKSFSKASKPANNK